MPRTAVRFFRVPFLLCILSLPAGVHAQRQRQMQPPDENAYGSKFFDQLRGIFGTFRNSDLQRVFQMAQPIQCSELVVGKGEWRTVAFFNEDRSLGEWCRNSIAEVKSDLSVYTFKGPCAGDQGAVQVTTEFPVGASIDAYNQGRIGLDQIDVNVNAPVTANFDPRTQAYIFELPYLFLVGRENNRNVYSHIAPRVDDGYAPEVTNRWECKAVKSSDVTYRFLICRTATVARNRSQRYQNRDPDFGASAYFILSDGMEAQTSVNLSFGDAGRVMEDSRPAPAPVATSPRTPPAVAETEKPAGNWQLPDSRLRIVDVGKSEFRLRFSPQTWAGKIESPEILSEQKMSATLSARLQEGADFCSWRPGPANLVDRLLAGDPDPDVSYSLKGIERSSQAAASILFEVQTHSGTHLGTLQCYFPRIDSPANIDFDRWVSIVGGHLTLEIRH